MIVQPFSQQAAQLGLGRGIVEAARGQRQQRLTGDGRAQLWRFGLLGSDSGPASSGTR